MLITVKAEPEDELTLDSSVVTMDISDGAKVLYAHITGLGTQAFDTTSYEMAESLNISPPTFYRRMRELREAGLLVSGV